MLLRYNFLTRQKLILPLFFILLLISSALFTSEISILVNAQDEFKKIGYDVPDLFKFLDVRNGAIELDGLSEVQLFDPKDDWQITGVSIKFRLRKPDFLIFGFTTLAGDKYSALSSTSDVYPGEFILFEGWKKAETQPWPEFNFKKSGDHVLTARIENSGIAVRIDKGVERIMPGSEGKLFGGLSMKCAQKGAGVSVYNIQVQGFHKKKPFQVDKAFTRQGRDWRYGFLLAAVLCAVLFFGLSANKQIGETARARAGQAIWYLAGSLIFSFLHILLHATLLLFALLLILWPVRQNIPLNPNYRRLPPWRDPKAMMALAAAALSFSIAFGILSFAKALLRHLPKTDAPPQENLGSDNITNDRYCIMVNSEPPYEIDFKARIKDQGLMRVDIGSFLEEEWTYRVSVGTTSSFVFSPGHKVGSVAYSKSFMVSPIFAESTNLVPVGENWFDVRIRNGAPLLVAEINRTGGSVGRGSSNMTKNLCFTGFLNQISINDVKIQSLKSRFFGFLIVISDVMTALGSLLFILVMARLGWRLMAGNPGPEASLFKSAVLWPTIPLLILTFIQIFWFRNHFELIMPLIIRTGGFGAFIFCFLIFSVRSGRYLPKLQWWKKIVGLTMFAIVFVWLTPVWLPGYVVGSSYNSVLADLPTQDMFLVDPRITHNNSVLYDQKFLGKKLDVRETLTRRVFIFGGSQAYGVGVDNSEKTNSAYLERILNSKYSRLGKFEIGDAAVPGGSLRQAYVNLEKVVQYFNPEIAIFSTVLNDILWNHGSDEDYQKVAGAKHYDPEIPRLFEPLFRHARILFINRPWDMGSKSYMYNKYCRDFDLICGLCRRLNIRFAFVLEPNPIDPNLPKCTKGKFCMEGIDTSSLVSDYHQYIIDKDKANEAPMIDTQVAVFNHREEFLFVDNIHLTERGQELYAETIAEAIALRWPDPPLK